MLMRTTTDVAAGVFDDRGDDSGCDDGADNHDCQRRHRHSYNCQRRHRHSYNCQRRHRHNYNHWLLNISQVNFWEKSATQSVFLQKNIKLQYELLVPDTGLKLSRHSNGSISTTRCAFRIVNVTI